MSVQGLCPFQLGEFFDEFLLAVAWEGDGKLKRIADAFTAEHETATVLGVLHVGAGNEVGRRSWSFEFRVLSFAFRAGRVGATICCSRFALIAGGTPAVPANSLSGVIRRVRVRRTFR